jgi:hypothetical protein
MDELIEDRARSSLSVLRPDNLPVRLPSSSPAVGPSRRRCLAPCSPPTSCQQTSSFEPVSPSSSSVRSPWRPLRQAEPEVPVVIRVVRGQEPDPVTPASTSTASTRALLSLRRRRPSPSKSLPSADPGKQPLPFPLFLTCLHPVSASAHAICACCTPVCIAYVYL